MRKNAGVNCASEGRILLVGPHDPNCGEYTFLSPPLGVWRLAGVAAAARIETRVFDPNCCEGTAENALEEALADGPWDAIGFSTTGMTLRFDLALAHRARRALPRTLLVAGGMEATFDPEAMFRLGPFDAVVLGEGERPLLELAARARDGRSLEGIPGTACRSADGSLCRIPQPALRREELRDAILRTPYERMPYRAYWSKLERAYRVGELPMKADREARLAEIRSVRLITLNYCPMGCTFCSSTNFLNAAQDGTALIARLDPEECLTMLRRITAAFPDVKTVIFQDDIFVFPSDRRIAPLCEAILRAKEREEIPRDLRFISTNRIEAMTPERLALMRKAGFRVLGFGIESFSPAVLQEFNKARIHPWIEPVLEAALGLGITPFLDMILTSPRGGVDDLAENIRQAYRWTLAGCEVGMYPYVIPFSGSALAADPGLRPHTTYTRQHVAGTGLSWDQASKILPLDPTARKAILDIEEEFEAQLHSLQSRVAHLPSRVRSLLWVVCAIPVLRRLGQSAPDRDDAVGALIAHLPGVLPADGQALRCDLAAAALEQAI